jgi:hypothetical protein
LPLFPPDYFYLGNTLTKIITFWDIESNRPNCPYEEHNLCSNDLVLSDSRYSNESGHQFIAEAVMKWLGKILPFDRCPLPLPFHPSHFTWSLAPDAFNTCIVFNNLYYRETQIAKAKRIGI